ncbi:hypothetical protein Q4I28_000317 [Leishmania naiffi]|uniref:Uncharacterized protein n=1 Tax=Leishmania naiffi TaxID=5678 RepID=A0AAW3CAZ8_9TRYP
MIFIEPDVDCFRLHLRDVWVPAPVLVQNPGTIAGPSASAPTSALARPVSRCKKPNGGNHNAPLSHSGLKTETTTEAARARPSSSATREHNDLYADEASSCAKITLEERADAVHRALLSTLRACFPYEALDTLEFAYVLVVTHHTALSLGSQAVTEDELHCLTSLSGFLPEELRYRTFPSHLNTVIDPASVVADATTFVKSAPPATMSGVAADSATAAPAASSAARPSIRVMDDNAATSAVQEEESAAHVMTQALHSASMPPRFYDSIFLLSRALTPEQQALYYEMQLSGRCPVTCEAEHQVGAATEKTSWGSSACGNTNTRMELFSVIQGNFTHYVPVDGSGGGNSTAKAARHATSCSNLRHVAGESDTYSVSSTAPSSDEPAQAASRPRSASEARSLYFSVYRIPLSRFRPAEQQYYTSQREELRWRQRHRGRSSYHTWWRKGQSVRQATSTATPSCGSGNSSESEADGEDWEKAVDPTVKVASPLSGDNLRRNHDVANAIEKLFSSEGHSASGAAEQAPAAEQRSAFRFFRTCHEVLTNYAIAHSPYADTGAMENEEAAVDRAPSPSPPATTPAVHSPSDRQDHPRLPWFPRRFSGVSYVGVTRLLYSLAPCNCYHLVMKDHNALYYAQSHRAPYKPQTAQLCLVSDLSPETGGAAALQRQQDGTGGGGGGVLRLAQLKSSTSPLATTSRGVGESHTYCDTELHRAVAAASDAPPTAPASVAEVRRRRIGEQKTQAVQSRAPSQMPGVTGQVLSLDRAAPGPRTDKLAVGDGAGGAAAIGCRSDLVCMPFPSRAPSPERADRASVQTWVTTAATTHGRSHPPSSATPMQPGSDLVSATDGFLCVSVSLICNSISGNPQTRLQSLTEKGVHVPSFLLPDGARTVGSPDAASSCRSSHDVASVDGGADAAAVNLFKALSQSSFAHHKLRYGCIRSVISVAVLDSSQLMSHANPAACSGGGTSSDGARQYGTREATQLQLSQDYSCRGLVDHTWLSIPVQRTPAEQEAIHWMPVMLGCTDCVSDVGLRTAVHLGIFPHASPPSRGAEGSLTGLSAACLPTSADQFDGVLPTREGTLSSLRPSQRKKSASTTTAGYAHADARPSNDKKDMSRRMPPVAPLRPYPVNGAKAGVTAATSATTASPSCAAAINVRAAPPNIQEKSESPPAGRECESEAVAAPATTISLVRPSSSSPEIRVEQAHTPVNSSATLHQQKGVPTAFNSAGGDHSHAGPHRMAGTASPPLTRPSSPSRRPDAQVPRTTTTWDRLSITVTAPNEKSQMGNKNVNVGFDEEERVGAPIPPATATSVRLARGGIALTFDAWPAQQRKSLSSFKAGGALKARRLSTNLTPESVQGSVEFLRDCSVAVTRSRHGGVAVKGRSDNEASVETAADSFDGDDDYLERCPSPICTRASARTPQAVGWTPPRGTSMTRALAAAQHADNTRRGCGGAGVGDDAKFNMQSSSAFAAALPGYSAGAREAPQAATKTINWADKPFSSATATRTGTHTGGSLHFPSVFHTTVETTGMAEEQLDAEGSAPRRGVAMPTTYAAAAERHAGVLGTSGNHKSSRSSGSPQVSLWASRLNPFLAQAHKTPAANSSQPYHLDAGAPPHPPPPPHCLASYTPFQRASGLPQHVQQQQQPLAPLLAAHCTVASATPTPTHRFSALFTPFGQGTELLHQTAAPTPEQQRLLHTHPQDRWPLPASRQHSTGATGFSAASAPHSRVLPSTLDLSASGVSVSSNSDSASMWLPLQQHPSASPPSQERFFDDDGALHTTCEKREDRRGTVITANTATPTATGDGDIAPRGVQSAARPSAYFTMTWNARKTVKGTSEQRAEPPQQQQQRLSDSVAGHPFSSRWLSSPPRHEAYEQTQEPQSHPRSSFYPPSSPLGLPSSFAAARSAPPLSRQTSNRSAHYTAPARQTIGAGYPSLLPPPLAPRRGSGGGGQAASAADARHLSRSLFIDEYDNAAATASSVPHLHGNGQGASRVRPRGLSAMDAAWWQPVRELSSAPNLHYGAAIPAADHLRSSTSALCLPGTDQPYNLLRSTTSNPNSHRRDLYGNDSGCHNAGDATADDLAFQQRRRHSYYCCDASSLGCGAATAPLHPARAAVPPSRLGGLKADAGFEENQGVDEVCAAELSLSPVTPRRTQMQTPFAMRRARCAAATAGHSLGLLSCHRPPLAPRSADGDAARNTLSGGAGKNKLRRFCAGYGAAMPSYSAAWRDGLSVRERVQLRRWALDKEERLRSYRTHLQENYLWGSMPKRYCFERQAGDAAADMTSASLGSGPVRQSDVEGDGKQQQFATVGYAAWTPRTTAVPPVRHQTAGVLEVERDAQDFRLGGHRSAPDSTTLEARGLSVDAARVCQAEAHLRQHAKQQAYMEARQQVEELLDGAAAARLATTGVNVSFTLRDVATVFLRLPRTSLHVPRTPGSGPPYVIGGAGLEVLDICHAVCRTEGVSCFLSRRPTQLRGGWTSYLERINLYQEPFFLRDQAFVLLLPVPHAPTLKVCVAIHNINDLLALVCQTPVARILPTTEETWMRQRQYGFEDANGDAEEPQKAEAVVEERRWLFGLFTTRRLAPAAGARAPGKAQQQLPSLEDSDVARRAECCRLRREYQMDGLCLTWRHRVRLWYALLRAGLNCLELPACTSPLLIDPAACKARCALLCGRIAAYAVAHYRLEMHKAIRQLYLETRAAELSKDRMLKPCDRTHHGTTRGIRLGWTSGSSSHGAASRLLCTSPTLASVSAQQERCGECFDSDAVSSTVHQGMYSEARGGARDSALKTAPYNYFSSTDEAARDPRAVRSGVAFTLNKPSITCSRQPPLAASTSASFHTGHFESARQRMGNRSDEQHQWGKTSIPPQPSAMRDTSRSHPPLRRLASSSRDGWATGPPTPRTTRSMQLRLAATQRVAAGDVPAASLRHATHRSGLGEGRLSFSDYNGRSDTFGLPSHRSFMPASGRPSAPPPRQQQQQPLWSSDLGTCATSASPVEGLDGEIDTAGNHTRARNNAAATAHRHGSTPARPVLAAPGFASANVLYDVEADNHRYASGGACGAMHLVRSAATSLDQRSHASSASHGLFSPARSTVASYPSGTSLAPSSKVKVSAAATRDAQRIVLPSTATSTDLDPLLHVDRDDVLASALARLTEDRAASIAPPLTAVLSIVPLSAQPVRGAGAGVVEAGDAPTAASANASAPLPLYAGFIPTPLEVQQRLAQPFSLSIGQVQQLLQWQWEHHQHCYTLMPTPLFIGAAAGPTEVDLSLRLSPSPQRVDSASRGGFNGQASAVPPPYAVSPLARELLLHLLRWSWLLPIDHEATQCSRRHRLATTTSHGISSFVGFLILPSARHRSRWRILPLIVLLVAAAEYSAWCLRALLFFAIGYCALNCMTVGLLTPLPSHRGARSRSSCGEWLPRRWWWGMQRAGTTDGCRGGHRRSASRLARNPFPVPENNVPPIDNRVSLLYSLGESTTLDMLERRRVHCAAQAVLVRVLRLQSAAASLLSRCQLFCFGYSTALSLWVVLLLVAYALLYVAYLEAGRVVQRSPAEAVFTAAVGQQRGAFWSAKSSNYESDKAPLALWQVTRGVVRAIWMNTYVASVASFGLSQPAASASAGAAVPPLEPLQPTMDGDNEAAAAGVAGTVETQLFGHSAAVVATERGSGREGVGEAHGHHTNPSYFYQNGRYYAYDAEPPAWAKSEAATAVSASPSTVAPSGVWHTRPPAQPQQEQQFPSVRVVQSQSERLNRVTQSSASDGKDTRGSHRSPALDKRSADTMDSKSVLTTTSSSIPYRCPSKWTGSSAADPSVLWFLAIAYIVTVCLPWSPYRWLWWRVWSILTHDDALARRPLLTV